MVKCNIVKFRPFSFGVSEVFKILDKVNYLDKCYFGWKDKKWKLSQGNSFNKQLDHCGSSRLAQTASVLSLKLPLFVKQRWPRRPRTPQQAQQVARPSSFPRSLTTRNDTEHFPRWAENMFCICQLSLEDEIWLIKVLLRSQSDKVDIKTTAQKLRK